MLVGADGVEVLQPQLVGAAVVELALLRLGRLADLLLDAGIVDGDETPGLLVGPAGRRPRARMRSSITARLTGRSENSRTVRRRRMTS